MTWDEGDEHNTILCGMDGEYRVSKIRLASMDFTAYSTAAWKDDDTLVINMRPVESVCRRTIEFDFRDRNVVTFSPSSQPPTTTIADSISQMIDLPVLPKPLADMAFDQLPKIIDATHRGVFED